MSSRTLRLILLTTTGFATGLTIGILLPAGLPLWAAATILTTAVIALPLALCA